MGFEYLGSPTPLLEGEVRPDQWPPCCWSPCPPPWCSPPWWVWPMWCLLLEATCRVVSLVMKTLNFQTSIGASASCTLEASFSMETLLIMEMESKEEWMEWGALLRTKSDSMDPQWKRGVLPSLERGLPADSEPSECLNCWRQLFTGLPPGIVTGFEQLKGFPLMLPFLLNVTSPPFTFWQFVTGVLNPSIFPFWWPFSGTSAICPLLSLWLSSFRRIWTWTANGLYNAAEMQIWRRQAPMTGRDPWKP